jgi:RND family efflux transporter MFP subunit
VNSAARAGLAALLNLALAACGAPPLPSAALATLPLATAPVEIATGAAAPWEGVIQAVREAELTAQTDGRVTEVRVDIGAVVAAGDVLLRLTATEQDAAVRAARADLAAAEALRREAEPRQRRLAALAAQGYVATALLEEAEAGRASAEAAVRAAHARLAAAEQQAAYTVVRAPFDGVVRARAIEPGERVGPGTPLLTLHAPDALRAEVPVPASVAEAIRAAPQARIALADGRMLEVAAVTVAPSAEAGSLSVLVRAPLPPLQRPPVPGATVKVEFPALTGPALPRLPVSALVRRGELTAVYVVDADGRPQLRQLRLGRRDGAFVQVLSGLRGGEQVARDPLAAARARSAQPSVTEGRRDD